MSLREELGKDIDEERFDEIFDVLFVQPKAALSSEFYERELDGAAQYPLLYKVLEKTDALALEWRDQGYSEEVVNAFLRGRAVPCLAIAAYVSTEIEDIPDA